MKATHKTKIIFILAVISAVVAGGIYAFLFISMKDKTEAAVNLSAELNDLSGQQSRYSTAATALSDEKQNIAQLSSYYIKESEIVSFTKKIEALGPQAGVTVNLESLDPGVTGTTPYLNFRVTGEGRFENVQRLLILLQNFPGKFEWKTVRIVQGAGAPPPEVGKAAVKVGAPKWKVDATLTAFSFTKE